MIFFYLQEHICHYKLFRTHQRRPPRAPVRLLRRQGGPAPQPVPLDLASPLVLLVSSLCVCVFLRRFISFFCWLLLPVYFCIAPSVDPDLCGCCLPCCLYVGRIRARILAACFGGPVSCCLCSGVLCCSCPFPFYFSHPEILSTIPLLVLDSLLATMITVEVLFVPSPHLG